jgi:hypothetical protein
MGKARQAAALRALATVYININPRPASDQANEQPGDGMNALLDLAAMHGLNAAQIRAAAEGLRAEES